VPGFLDDVLAEYIPGPLLAEERKSSHEWQSAIFFKHARSCTDLPMQSYLTLLRKRVYYGTMFFAVKVRAPGFDADCC
jgi:hypothetical protein